MATEPVTAVVQIAKVQTLADGGVRWTFDGPETAVMQTAALMEMRRLGFPVTLTIEPVTSGAKSQDDERRIHI